MRLTRSQRPLPGLFAGALTAPLANVVLLLLLFFLLGSSLVLQPGVAVSLPAAGAGLTVPALPESPPRINSPPPPAPLPPRAPRLPPPPRGGPAGRTVVLRADRGTPYETVMAVGARALMAGCPVVLATAPEEAGNGP